MKPTRRTFLDDASESIAMGVRALQQDDFSRCFAPISALEMDSARVLYVFSIFVRYFVLFPWRLVVLVGATLLFALCYVLALFVQADPEPLFRFYCNAFLRAFGAKIHHHGAKTRPNGPVVFVANHTSFADYIILSAHRFCHAAVSEGHGGLFGFLFTTLLARIGSIAFKRSEKHDRALVLQKMRAFVARPQKTPLLVFPEGTCVNNRYTVLFQQGAFALGVPVAPVAIKFRRNLLDPYWNRRKHTFTMHLLYLMTRWRLEADVWWLPHVSALPSESPADFALRVKAMISARGGLKNVLWNGYFKNSPVLRDRELLRTAYRNIYNLRPKAPKYVTPQKEHRFSHTKKHTLHTETPNTRLYFGMYTYKEFVSLVLQEYLNIKSRKLYDHAADDDVLMQNTPILKTECACRELEKKYYKKIGSPKSCRMEFFQTHL